MFNNSESRFWRAKRATVLIIALLVVIVVFGFHFLKRSEEKKEEPLKRDIFILSQKALPESFASDFLL